MPSVRQVTSAVRQVPTPAAQQARGPRDAWHRHRAAAEGRLRDWYAICVERGTQPFADSEPLRRIGRLKKRLRSVSSLLIVLSLTPTRISILAPGMGPGTIPLAFLRSSVVDVCPAGAVVVSRRRSFGLPQRNPKPGTSVLLTTATNTSPTLAFPGRLVPPPRSPLITCSPLPASIRRTMLPDSRRVSSNPKLVREGHDPSSRSHRRRDGPLKKTPVNYGRRLS